MTCGYKVMIESKSCKRPSWIWLIRWPQWSPALAPSKNEFSKFWSTSVFAYITSLKVPVTSIINELEKGFQKKQ